MKLQRDWLWDKRISIKKAQAVLRNPEDGHFLSLAGALLSRKNTPKEVFRYYLKPLIFIQNWRQIKRQMRKDNWNDPRIEYWQAIYENLKERPKFKKQAVFKKDLPREAGKESDFCREVADKIKIARKMKGLTQAGIAKRLNISQQVISRIERGRENISLRTLKKILDVLGMRVNFESI